MAMFTGFPEWGEAYDCFKTKPPNREVYECGNVDLVDFDYGYSVGSKLICKSDNILNSLILDVITGREDGN